MHDFILMDSLLVRRPRARALKHLGEVVGGLNSILEVICARLATGR
jgi:hypothetical protein